jgi:hypothetical protein
VIGPTDIDIRQPLPVHITVGFRPELATILGHQFFAKTDSVSISAGSWLEPTVIGCKKNFATFLYDV